MLVVLWHGPRPHRFRGRVENAVAAAAAQINRFPAKLADHARSAFDHMTPESLDACEDRFRRPDLLS
ncbi:hypothetical protein SBA4_4570002 [Candidatus Sulfopaludibacter sp. SbA4]|nr:hypothetical protein SBA4_4570002 [Candidatus Sulfopaludibacter sp. SbA4]